MQGRWSCPWSCRLFSCPAATVTPGSSVRSNYVLRADYIDDTFDRIEPDYRSVEAYLKGGMSLTDEGIAPRRESISCEPRSNRTHAGLALAPLTPGRVGCKGD